MIGENDEDHRAVWSRKRKVLAVTVTLLVIAAGGFAAWELWFKYTSVRDLPSLVTGSPAAPGFKDSLIGKTLTVRGKVTGIETTDTTLGRLFTIELDNFNEIHLVKWDECDYEVNAIIKMDVTFEVSCWNQETHVYSPQLDFPVLCVILGTEHALRDINSVQGVLTKAIPVSPGNLSIRFDWVEEDMPLSIFNCSLRAGTNSWAADYVDAGGGMTYGEVVEYCEDVPEASGDAEHILFIDADGNNNLSTGDRIDLSDLPFPEMQSGVLCYMLCLDFGEVNISGMVHTQQLYTYIPMVREGVLTISNHSLYASMGSEEIAMGAKYTFRYISEPHPWERTSLILRSGGDHETLRPLARELNGSAPSTYFNRVIEIDGKSWWVNVTDMNGDGLADVGDSFTVTTDGYDSLNVSEPAGLTLVDEETHMVFWRGVMPIDDSQTASCYLQ